jgi:hypothetical protein
MAVLGILKLDNVEYSLLSSHYYTWQYVNSWGTPPGDLNPFRFNLVIESDSSSDLLEWILSGEPKDGIITFYKTDRVTKYKDIKFKKAYCTSYTETFFSGGNLAMYQFISISEPRTLLPKKAIVQPAKIAPQESKRITDIKWMCAKMKKSITEAGIGEKTSLLIKTVNYSPGETITIIVDEAGGKELKSGTKEITYSGKVNADGIAELKEEVKIETV